MTDFINKFKKGSTYYEIHAEESVKAQSADTAVSASTVQSAEGIGNVRKYSGFYDGKQREGLQIINNSGEGSEALIELNDKGNFALESKTKHLNLESAKGVQVKPTTTLTLDSTRRIIAGKGNEIQVEARFDDFGDVTGYKGADEEWAELKINSRNLDLRCREHGGIALQIAGKDKDGNENKIKFESDRTNSISEVGTYNGEGGKGLEFGTFNNLHSSLYTGDYRFRGNGRVYGVLREAPVTTETGKIDYQTQPDDFKDPINETTPNATWNDIIGAANKCKDKEAIASEAYVLGEIARAQLPESEVDTSQFATTGYVQEYVAEHGGSGGGSYAAGSGIHIEDNTISVNNYSNIEPLTALTDNIAALNDVKFGKSKGNFAIDVKGKYTWESTNPKDTTTVDEYNNVHIKGDRVLNYTNESFYTDPDKVYYKAGDTTVLADGVTEVPKDTIVYNPACEINFTEAVTYQYYEMSSGETSFYEDPEKFFYKCKAKKGDFLADGTPAPKDTIVPGAGLTEEEIAYYDSKGEIVDEDGTVIQSAIWAKTDLWKKSTLWSMNEININLETDSKIKFDGKKIETVWAYPEVEGGDDVDHKMDDILLSTNTLSTDANEVVFEKKISKNGDREGQDTEIVYTFGNNVADTTKVPDLAAFMSNYRSKHSGTYTDEELTEKYNAFLAEGNSFEIRVKVSELLGLVSRVAELEARIEALESGVIELNNN